MGPSGFVTWRDRLRGMRIDLNGLAILLISGTASIDEQGKSIHIGDFRAQLRRTFWNITQLLEADNVLRRRLGLPVRDEYSVEPDTDLSQS